MAKNINMPVVISFINDLWQCPSFSSSATVKYGAYSEAIGSETFQEGSVDGLVNVQ